MEKRGRQIFSKTVRASNLSRQRTLEINNAHLDRSRCGQHLQEATKNCLIHGELTETNKALDTFLLRIGCNLNFRRFLLDR